jgi:signal transduction histidine kinase
VAAADAERRRLERDLHDGAQSRFVAIALELRRAHDKAPPGSEVARMLERAIAELGAGLDDLRDLARGIHPTLLADHGVAAAVRALAARVPVPVVVTDHLEARLPPELEAALYFSAAEAITNAAKHARASEIAVEIARDDDVVLVGVSDDGVGGADAQAGSGLTGLRDRLATVGGRLEIDSRPGGGTRVAARVPLPVAGD